MLLSIEGFTKFSLVLSSLLLTGLLIIGLVIGMTNPDSEALDVVLILMKCTIFMIAISILSFVLYAVVEWVVDKFVK